MTARIAFVTYFFAVLVFSSIVTLGMAIMLDEGFYFRFTVGISLVAAAVFVIVTANSIMDIAEERIKKSKNAG